ncbi:MAG: hypothetical protein ABMA01_19720 [Chthoniobacteraceae bacterium]
MKSLIIALLSVSAALVPRAAAMPPMSRTLQGEVAAVEPVHKRFTVRTVKTPAGVTVSWGPDTLFFRDGNLVPGTSLARGQQVTARYRIPFFGPKIAVRVFILPGAK